MLTEERYADILQLLAEQKVVTVTQLTEKLHVSESTVRRDLIALDNAGKLCKVHGGATLNSNRYFTREEDVITKQDQHSREKSLIAKYAAGLIEAEDFVYIDAGTTTFKMLEFLEQPNVTYVTNGIQHAARLAAMGFKVYLPGGQIKPNTQAVIGIETIKSLATYNFTKGFFGVNGVSATAGYSTPDVTEGNVKSAAMARCKKPYVLADGSKFKTIFPVTFGKLEQASIITDRLPDSKYKKLTNVVEVGED